jgi:hypothetical protein
MKTDSLSLQAGVRYIVTRDSKNQEFQCGDHIWLDEKDGSIICREAMGWMPAEDVEAATEGMEVAVDTEWIAARREKLERQLADLNQGVKHD